MNWDDIRVFLAVRRAGTLRGASRELGVDQTTVGRRLAALESGLGVTLFLRSPGGYALTGEGERALAAAERMERLAVSLERQAAGADARIDGEVRVTTTDALAVDFVIPAIERLRASHPGVRVILGTTTRLLDLGRREADIAVRTSRPTQPSLIVRKSGCMRRGATWPSVANRTPVRPLPGMTWRCTSPGSRCGRTTRWPVNR